MNLSNAYSQNEFKFSSFSGTLLLCLPNATILANISSANLSEFLPHLNSSARITIDKDKNSNNTGNNILLMQSSKTVNAVFAQLFLFEFFKLFI